MFNKHDTARDAQTGEAKPFFIEFFLCNPALGAEEPIFGQLPGKPQKPSYLMVKAGAWGEDAVQLFDLKGELIDRIHAENVGCEYGEYC